MKWDKVALFLVERVFDLLEFISNQSDKRKAKQKAKELTLKDLLDAKRDTELLRRTQAPTVVIPPPSERERQKRR